MKAFVYEGAKKVSLREVAEPNYRDSFVKIKVAYAGMCGGDMNVYNGTHPRAKAPLVMGHEASGIIVEGHPNLAAGTSVAINPLITCGKCVPCKTGNEHVCQKLGLHGIDADGMMAEYSLARADRVLRLPEGLNLKAGALAEPVAVAIHAIRDTGYLSGDNALIFGAGPIGLALALSLRAFGCTSLAIVEVNDNRREFGAKLGFDTFDPRAVDVTEEIMKRTAGNGADYIFDCAGHQSVVDLLPRLVKIRGKIVIVAHYKKKAEFDFLLGMFKEFSVHFVRVYRDRDFEIALSLLGKDKGFEQLVTHVLQPEQVQAGFDMMQDTSTTAVKILYDFMV